MECIYALKEHSLKIRSGSQPTAHATILSGQYLRRSDNQYIQRYFCKTCRRSFSSESLSLLKYQKKRYLNDIVFSLFASGASQRRIARLIQVNKKTVVRKFNFLGRTCLSDIKDRKHLPNRKIKSFAFDDMESFEHTKLKPLSISMAVEEKTRLILDFKVSSMKAKGHLSARAKRKYGYRKDERKKHLKELLESISSLTAPACHIKSDMNPHYILPVKRIFSQSTHEVFKGKRGCIVGQGELKAIGFDPLFSFNHTAAMLRANINRLFRRTWNTTKKPQCLSYHIAIYIFYHNLRLIKPTPT